MNSTSKFKSSDWMEPPMVANTSGRRIQFQQSHSFFDENYFKDGKRSKKSLYEDYRWLPELTKPLAAAICRFTGIIKSDVVVDYGCARGYLVRAFIENGIEAFGIDVSEYAITHSDLIVREKLHHLTNETLAEAFETLGCSKVDWLIAKDVFEHIDPLCCTQHFVMLPIWALNSTCLCHLEIRGGTAFLITSLMRAISLLRTKIGGVSFLNHLAMLLRSFVMKLKASNSQRYRCIKRGIASLF